jgi:hypothetical protein
MRVRDSSVDEDENMSATAIASLGSLDSLALLAKMRKMPAIVPLTKSRRLHCFC